MEEILKYENRDQLYQSVISDLGLSKINENYDSKNFGNFFITLAAENFFIDYVNDRSFLTINIRSKLDPTKSFALVFIKNLLYNTEDINSSDDGIDNVTRITTLNNFLKEDFEKINALYRPEYYPTTRQTIENLLKEQFKKKNPGMI